MKFKTWIENGISPDQIKSAFGGFGSGIINAKYTRAIALILLGRVSEAQMMIRQDPPQLQQALIAKAQEFQQQNPVGPQSSTNTIMQNPEFQAFINQQILPLIDQHKNGSQDQGQSPQQPWSMTNYLQNDLGLSPDQFAVTKLQQSNGIVVRNRITGQHVVIDPKQSSQQAMSKVQPLFASN